MMPNLGGLDPRRIQSMMKQMGIENNEISAKRVIIETNDNKKIIIENPSVTEISMQGQKSFQISGDVKTEKNLEIPEDDILMVCESTKLSKEDAKKLLEKTEGDIAKAISLATE
ncbi:MAG: nascent polypeptide-associated complex protein [Candidatus ainarchaeum sp.]|nr:nascent polypeptide-associated complex protein [Candidatus ainarchaeum sp.]